MASSPLPGHAELMLFPKCHMPGLGQEDPIPRIDVSTGGDRGAAIITFNGPRVEPVLAEKKILAGFQRKGTHVTPLAHPAVCVPGQDLLRIQEPAPEVKTTSKLDLTFLPNCQNHPACSSLC